MAPLISVVIPVHNCEEYIEECIDSVLNQKYNDFEIICILDGEHISTSNCAKYESHPKIKFYEVDYGGVSKARNIGYKHSKGKYIYYLDGDDILLPDALHTMAYNMERYNLDVLCFDAFTFLHDTGELAQYNRYERNLRMLGVVAGKLLLRTMIESNSFRSPTWLMCIKREFHEDNISFEEGIIHEDELFTYICLASASRTKWISDKLNKHRIRNNSIMSSKKTHTNVDGYIRVLTKMMEYNTNCDDMTPSGRYEYRIRKQIINLYNSLEEKEKGLVHTFSDYEIDLFTRKGAKDVIQSLCRSESLPKNIKNEYDLNNPLVSIIMPVYNSGLHLRDALDDIFTQSFKNIELICVDDGSTDDSLLILKEYSTKYQNMHILQQKNKYAGVARNNGLSIAKGKYIIFLDSDDRFESNMIKCALTRMIEEESDMVIFAANILDDKLKTYLPAPWFLRMNENISSFIPASRNDLFQITTGNPWNKLFKMSLIKDNNLTFQSTRRNNDVKFVYGALVRSKKVAIDQKVLVHYRKNTGNSLQDTFSKSPKDLYYAFSAIKQDLININEYEKYKQSFLNATLRNIVNSLQKTNTIISVFKLYTLIKTKIIYEFELVDKNRSYFYNKKDYEWLEYIKLHNVLQYMLLRGNVSENGLIRSIISYLRKRRGIK